MIHERVLHIRSFATNTSILTEIYDGMPINRRPLSRQGNRNREEIDADAIQIHTNYILKMNENIIVLSISPFHFTNDNNFTQIYPKR